MSDSNLGIFDGFEHFQTTTDDDIKLALKEALVVLDTNVLLNLYRFNSQTRSDLISILTKIGDRLWIPHQVLHEFWNRRDAAIEEPEKIRESTIKKIIDYRQKTAKAIEDWLSRCAFSAADTPISSMEIEYAFNELIAKIDQVSRDEWADHSRDTTQDPLMPKFEDLFNGRRGAPYSPEEYQEKLEEAKDRMSKDIPPGYLDKDKEGDKKYGDFFVWDQMVSEVKRRGLSVLFVTGDVKSDWWSRDSGKTRGPRPELVIEMLKMTSQRLFMTQPQRLLQLGADALHVEVDASSVFEAERIVKMQEGEEYGGWNREALDELTWQLIEEGWEDRYSVLLSASEREGFISREEIYRICSYDESRQLKGFTRPIKRISQAIRDAGGISYGAVDIIEPVYGADATPGHVSGFQVNSHVLPLLKEVAEEDES